VGEDLAGEAVAASGRGAGVRVPPSSVRVIVVWAPPSDVGVTGTADGARRSGGGGPWAHSISLTEAEEDWRRQALARPGRRRTRSHIGWRGRRVSW
jgi:hypothetical protein